MKTMQNKNNISQSGFTLTEVMISAAILSTVMLGAMTVVSGIYSSQQYSFYNSNRDRLSSKLDQASTDPQAIFISAQQTTGPANNGNILLNNCVIGDKDTASCTANVEVPFTLYEPDFDGANPIAIAGPQSFNNRSQSNNPVHYSQASLQPCPQGALSDAELLQVCPFEMQTSFVATCPGGAATCNQASSVTVRYKLVNHAQENDSGVSDAQKVSGLSVVRGKSGTVTFNTQEVSLLKTQDGLSSSSKSGFGCEAGEVAMGFDGQGNLFCQKIDHMCPPGQTIQGLDRYMRPVTQKTGTASYTGAIGPGGQFLCAPINCNAGPMSSMLNSNNGVIQANCIAQDARCTNQNQVSNQWVYNPSVVTNLKSTGLDTWDVECNTFANVCIQSNENGANPSALNYTAGFNSYSFEVNGGNINVNAQCKSFGCYKEGYMCKWDSDGNCDQSSCFARAQTCEKRVAKYKVEQFDACATCNCNPSDGTCNSNGMNWRNWNTDPEDFAGINLTGGSSATPNGCHRWTLRGGNESCPADKPHRKLIKSWETGEAGSTGYCADGNRPGTGYWDVEYECCSEPDSTPKNCGPHHPHGAIASRNNPNTCMKTTWQCNDGSWQQTGTEPVDPYVANPTPDGKPGFCNPGGGGGGGGEVASDDCQRVCPLGTTAEWFPANNDEDGGLSCRVQNMAQALADGADCHHEGILCRPKFCPNSHGLELVSSCSHNNSSGYGCCYNGTGLTSIANSDPQEWCTSSGPSAPNGGGDDSP